MELAIEAENISAEAYAIIKGAVDKSRNNADQIHQINLDLAELDRKVNSSKQLADDALNVANNVSSSYFP